MLLQCTKYAMHHVCSSQGCVLEAYPNEQGTMGCGKYYIQVKNAYIDIKPRLRVISKNIKTVSIRSVLW